MPDSTPFPFLHLPILVQLLIVKCLDVSDFLMFSFISRRAKSIAKQEKLNVDSFHWVLDDNWETYELRLKIENLNFIVFHAKYQVEAMQPELGDKLIQMSVDKKPITIHRRQTRYNKFWSIEDPILLKNDAQKLLEHLSKHFLSLVNVTKFEFKSVNLQDPEDFWDFQFVENWEKVKIEDRSARPATISIKTLKFCLATLNTKQLHLKGHVEEGFKWTTDCGVLKTEDLTIYDSKWMTLDALLAMECKRLSMSSPANQLSDSDLNTIIKHWLSGGLRNLKELVVNLGRGNTEERLDSILEGIETFQWEQRPSLQRHSAKTVRDIRRSDETFATAALLYGARIFKFLVWPSQNVNGC